MWVLASVLIFRKELNLLRVTWGIIQLDLMLLSPQNIPFEGGSALAEFQPLGQLLAALPWCMCMEMC